MCWLFGSAYTIHACMRVHLLDVRIIECRTYESVSAEVWIRIMQTWILLEAQRITIKPESCTDKRRRPAACAASNEIVYLSASNKQRRRACVYLCPTQP
jgi:hypothetical protein